MEVAGKEEKKLFIGIVVSDKMDGTVVVKTERTFRHPRFHKIVRKVKKYKVHDGDSLARLGDTVSFYEGRPCSKTKYMYLEKVIKSNAVDATAVK